jgi:hypothetical protein
MVSSPRRRDALKSRRGAELFGTGLYEFLFGNAALPSRFNHWCEVIKGFIVLSGSPDKAN